MAVRSLVETPAAVAMSATLLPVSKRCEVGLGDAELAGHRGQHAAADVAPGRHRHGRGAGADEAVDQASRSAVAVSGLMDAVMEVLSSRSGPVQ